MPRIFTVTMLFVGLCMLVNCAKTDWQVKSAHDPRANFVSVTTFRWTSSTLERLHKSTLTNEDIDLQLKKSIGDQLGKKGVRLATEDELPDVLVAYHAVASERALAEVGSAPTENATAGTVPTVVDQGTIIIDLINPDGGNVIWRGIGRAELKAKTQQEGLALLDRAAAQVLAQFPPR